MKRNAVSFRHMLAFSCFFLILFSILSISILAGLRMASIVEKDTKQTVLSVFEQSNLELARQLREVDEAYAAASLDINLIDAIRLDNTQDSLYERYINQNMIERILENIRKNHTMLENVVLYSPAGPVLYANSGSTLPYRKYLPEQDWFHEMEAGERESYRSGSFPLILGDTPHASEKQVYLLAQRLYDYRDMRYLGILVFVADTRVFYDTIDLLPLPGTGMGLAIIGADGQVLHARGISEERFAKLAQGWDNGQADSTYLPAEQDSYYVSGQAYDALGWSLLAATPRAYMVGDVRVVWSFTWKLALAVALLGGLFVIVLVRRMHRPIQQIETAIERFGAGELSARVPDSPFQEFGQIGNRFNSMAVQIDSLIDEVRETEREKQRIHLQMLEAQINPHFIYNTLDGIKWVAMMHGEADVARMITALVKLLRVSVYTKTEYISVGEELEYLKNYLTLIEMRYGAQISFTYDVDPAALPCLTLKLVLQPLVENAIFHGLMGKVENGIVKVSYRLTDSLELCVEDNGVGCKSTARGEHSGDRFSGIGLENIDRRIKLWCGEAYGVEVKSEPGRGTCVTVRQQVRRDEHDTGNDS